MKYPIKRFGILRTCRKIYSEAIDIFYAENTFKLVDGSHSAHTLPAELQKRLLPQLMEIVVNIHELGSFWEYHGERYINIKEGKDLGPGKMWEVIGMMKGLRKLRVRFQYDFTQYWDRVAPELLPEMVVKKEKDTLKPLMDFNWIPDFEVEVSWLVDEDSESTLKGAPFKLTRKLQNGASGTDKQ